MNTTWTPNEKQREFLEILENYTEGATLKDIELDTGKVFKTGTVNALVSKGVIKTTDKEVLVDLAYRGVVIGTVKKVWKVYTF